VYCFTVPSLTSEIYIDPSAPRARSSGPGRLSANTTTRGLERFDEGWVGVRIGAVLGIKVALRVSVGAAVTVTAGLVGSTEVELILMLLY
jgi:hypothetical protein